MLYREKVLEALEKKREDFSTYNSEYRDEAALYTRALKELQTLPWEAWQGRLQSDPWPGALPSPEVAEYRSLHIPFTPRWQSHQEARDWAYQTICATPTFAVDGSQILPSKDFSVPVALIQVAWFENRHLPTGEYVKENRVEIRTPREIMALEGGERLFSEATISLHRFQMEVEVLQEYITTHSRDPLPVVFLDGSLIVSFAERLSDEYRNGYVQAILRLLRTAAEARVPLVGYIDTTYARDLVEMLTLVGDLPPATSIHDAILVGRNFSWGDRTPFFYCRRKGILSHYEDQAHALGFLYLKTTRHLPPARLEIPCWVYEAGLLPWVVDIVRADLVIGNGYPYTIETADAAAVLTGQDREHFYRLFQEFLEREGIPLRISRKAVSKIRRR
ncbi:MAG: DNA double-strand break repair nuclease NurA [Nitrospinota bacterium]|nr:MAG: DNA double-strand break repair nuclease NurA [Nitrospinota bacterium]